MIIVYTPEGGEREEYDFMPGRLMSPEAEAIEDVGGEAWGTFEEFGIAFFRGSSRARRAALWIMKKRKNPRLKFNEVSFRANEVDVDYSDRERELILEAMLANPDLDEEQRETLETIVGTEEVSDVEKALETAGVECEPDLKDRSEFSGNAGTTLLRQD